MKPKIRNIHWHVWGFPHSSVGKESAYNARDLGLIPGSGRSPGEGNSYPFQYTSLEKPMDRGAWQLLPMGSQEWTQLSDQTTNIGIYKDITSKYSVNKKIVMYKRLLL